MIFNCYYTDNIHPQILEDHSRCCDKNQIKVSYTKDSINSNNHENAYNSHGDFMDFVMKSSNEDVVCFLDVDCIPYDRELLENIFRWVRDNNSFVGNAQNVSHSGLKYLIYAAPSLLMVSKKAWEELERPSFRWNMVDDVAHVDTAQTLTIRADMSFLNYRLLYPIGYDQEADKGWCLGNYGKYGKGTLYPGSWHYFRISEITKEKQIPELWSRRVDDILNDEKIYPNNYSPFYDLRV
jgi:hypothetical protein